jgi:ribonuclease D
VIDALAEDIELEPLYDLLEDESVLKVFHAARQDLEIFFHERGRLPHPVFDTQVAAMVCGFGDQIGYDRLAAQLAGARIDKSSRFTDWARRPLTRKQLDYALSDVTHLRTVYEKLNKKLEKNNRTHWLSEEMEILLHSDTYDSSPQRAWLRLKTRSRDRRYLALLRELAAWRERECQQRDQPRNRILRDEQLYDIAAQAPDSPEALARTRGLGGDFARGKLGRGILEAVEQAKGLPEEELPPAPPRSEQPQGTGATAELLKVLLKQVCEAHGVAQRLVANTADLDALAADDEAEVAALKGWRRELFGEQALALKHGRIALAVEKGTVKLVPLAGD